MRIAISSPDGLGDFILRLPLFRALMEAGHALQIWTLPPATELARILLPGAQIEQIVTHPYSRHARGTWRPFKREFASIQAWAADLFVVSAFHPSFFDEMWVDHGGAGVPVAGLVAEEEFWPSETISPARDLAQSYKIKAGVPTDLPEADKSRALAEAILGQPCTEDSAIASPVGSEQRASTMLRERGFSGDAFWVVCVGTRAGLQNKDWGEANWIAALTQMSGEGISFAFIGNEAEAESVERIRRTLPSPERHINLANNPPDLETVMGLMSLSSGYIGRDSGPMHLASALGRPVLAVFGAGHWGRFFPIGPTGVVVGSPVPCRGCNWRCHYEKPYCIKQLPLAVVMQGWERLKRATGIEVLETELQNVPVALYRDVDFLKEAHEKRREVMRKDRPSSRAGAFFRKLSFK